VGGEERVSGMRGAGEEKREREEEWREAKRRRQEGRNKEGGWKGRCGKCKGNGKRWERRAGQGKQGVGWEGRKRYGRWEV